MQNVRRRALIAGVIGLVGAFLGIAGAGHAYLRQWRRAFGWFVFVLGVAIVLVTTMIDPATIDSASSVWTVQMPLTVTVPMLVIQVLSALDAYIVGRRGADRSPQSGDAADVSTDETGGATCPHCGREVDPDLDFCHWCTEPLGERPHQPEEAPE